MVVTVNGVPSFELVPIDADDELIDQLIAHNPSFGKELRKRLGERAVPASTVARRL